MKILIRDLMQEFSSVPETLKSPALADRWTGAAINNILITSPCVINCIGVGNTNAANITISIYNPETALTENEILQITDDAPLQNGLYLTSKTYSLEEVEDVLTFDGETALLDGEDWLISYLPEYLVSITHDGTYIGRLALGKYRELGTAIAKEPGFYTTNESSKTLSGQVIPGAGGYIGRSIDLDVRYKIDRETFEDIYTAYRYISKSYPYFILLDCETHKLPYFLYRLYATTDTPISKLQSSTYRFLYSYKFNFIEAF